MSRHGVFKFTLQRNISMMYIYLPLVLLMGMLLGITGNAGKSENYNISPITIRKSDDISMAQRSMQKPELHYTRIWTRRFFRMLLIFVDISTCHVVSRKP